MNLTDEEFELFFNMCKQYTNTGKAAPTTKILDTIIKERNGIKDTVQRH